MEFWDEPTDAQNLRVCVRQKIETDPERLQLVTGIGYRLRAPD